MSRYSSRVDRHNSSSHFHRRRHSPDYHDSDHLSKHFRSGDRFNGKLDENRDDFWTHRRLERESIGESGLIKVWGHSPQRHPDSDLSGDEQTYALRDRKDSDESDSSSNSSSDSSEHNSRRHRKKSKKHKKSSKKSKKDSKEKKSKRREDRDKKDKKKKKKKDKQKSDFNDPKNEWIGRNRNINNEEAEEFLRELNEKKRKMLEDKSDEETVGPAPPKGDPQLNPKDFGRALLPGEGSAMAAFVAEGKRIPRRGEIGLTSEEIDSFENVGYVMSGSRHRRMEAVRLRKENQIYSADEKRALALFNKEERTKRETKILSQFKEMIRAKQEEHHKH